MDMVLYIRDPRGSASFCLRAADLMVCIIPKGSCSSMVRILRPLRLVWGLFRGRLLPNVSGVGLKGRSTESLCATDAFMYVCMYVCMYVGRYECMHVCMYVCVHACMQVHGYEYHHMCCGKP